MKIRPQSKNQFWRTPINKKKRFDADEYNQKENGWCAGFSTYIGKNNLKEKEYYVDLLFKDYSNKTVCYSLENVIKLN